MALTRQLNMLEYSGLIRLAQVQPELEYIFRHALVQETAYESLLRQDRRRLHLAVGEALERLYPDRLDELAGTLLHHFAAAGERDKGVAYARRAARQAQSMYAYGEALQYLQTALDLLQSTDAPGAGPRAEPTLDETYLALLEEFGDAHRLLGAGRGSEAIELYQQALELWGRSPGAARTTILRLHRKIVQTLADIKWSIGFEQFEAAARLSEKSRASLGNWLQNLENEPPHPEVVRLLVALSSDAWRIQTPPDWDAALRYAKAAVEMAEEVGSLVEQSTALGVLAMAHFGRGEPRDQLRVGLQRLEITQDPQFPDFWERLDALKWVGSALMYVGEYAEAIRHLLQAESLANRVQAIAQQTAALVLLAQCWFRLDRWEDFFDTEVRWRDLEERYPRERVGPT